MANLNTKQSVVDYLKSKGEDSSFTARKKLAESYGISNYSGSESQNIQLLKTLQSGNTTTNNTTKSNTNTQKAATETTKPDTTVVNKSSEVETTAKKSPLLGVSDDVYDKTQTTFNQSKESTSALKQKENALSSIESLTSKKDIISDDVMDSINSSFVVPSEVIEADQYLSAQLEKIQSGKTSYSDQVRDMMDKIMNREKFSYDVDTDPLFQQALASAMNSGKQAMQDTIGQASALTGGYGSTYATTAGNQAYNAFIEDAYDNIDEYYRLAMEAYQMEGDEMYRQYSMLSAEDDKEYNRNVAAYDATYQHRNRVYDEAYTKFRDDKSDAFAMANLQLSEHGQKVSDAYNYYNATSDYADTLYEREYNEWADSINMAWKEVEALNADAWADKNYAQTEDHFTRNQEFQATESQKNRDWQSAEAEKDRAFTASENAKNRAASKSGSRSSGNDGTYKFTTTEINALTKAFNDAGGGAKGWEAVVDLASAYGKAPQNDEQSSILKSVLGGTTTTGGNKSGIDWTNVDITKKTDTWNGFLNTGSWFGNIDSNNVYTVNGKDYYVEDLEALMDEDGLSKAMKDKIIKNIDNLKEGKTYRYSK